MHKNCLIIAALLFSLNALFGMPQEELPSRPLALSDLVAIAMENNTETSHAWWHAKRAAAAFGFAKSAYYPEISIQAAARHGRDFKFINGPDTNYTLLDADLILSLLLLDFGERQATVQSAKMVLLAANWQRDAVIQKVLVSVLEHTYTLFHAENILLANLASLADAEKMVKIAKELNRVGLNPVSDIYTSQATLSQMQMEVSQQKALVDIHKGRLAATLGLSLDTPLHLAPLAPLSPVHQEKTADLIALAHERRKDLFAKQAKVEESRAHLARARASYAPKLSLACRGGSQHAVHDKSNGAHYQIALNLEAPIFSGFDTVYKNRMAYADVETSQEELRRLEIDIALEVLTHSRNLEAAKEMLAHADDNLSNALKAYHAVLKRYQLGKEAIAEVSFAERQLASARIRYSDVKTKYLVSLANLGFATGSLTPFYYDQEETCAAYY